MFLGIDTSIGTAVALVDPDGLVRAEANHDNRLEHAEVIGTLLEKVTREAGTGHGSPEITAVAAGMGPGPFTGLRIGIAAARAFALARALPIVPVVSHDAVALGVLLHAAVVGEDDARFAVVTDARRREAAVTVYSGLDDNGLPVRVAEPALVAVELVDQTLAEHGARRHDADRVPAAMLALAAARARAARVTVAGEEPLYLRQPDVSVAPRKGVSQ